MLAGGRVSFSENRCPDVVYRGLVKRDAASDLVAALQTVIANGQLVRRGFLADQLLHPNGF
jgi:hypothetical protein